jgi:hypothetical protein
VSHNGLCCPIPLPRIGYTAIFAWATGFADGNSMTSVNWIDSDDFESNHITRGKVWNAAYRTCFGFLFSSNSADIDRIS